MGCRAFSLRLSTFGDVFITRASHPKIYNSTSQRVWRNFVSFPRLSVIFIQDFFLWITAAQNDRSDIMRKAFWDKYARKNNIVYFFSFLQYNLHGYQLGSGSGDILRNGDSRIKKMFPHNNDAFIVARYVWLQYNEELFSHSNEMLFTMFLS